MSRISWPDWIFDITSAHTDQKAGPSPGGGISQGNEAIGDDLSSCAPYAGIRAKYSFFDFHKRYIRNMP